MGLDLRRGDKKGAALRPAASRYSQGGADGYGSYASQGESALDPCSDGSYAFEPSDREALYWPIAETEQGVVLNGSAYTVVASERCP